MKNLKDYEREDLYDKIVDENPNASYEEVEEIYEEAEQELRELRDTQHMLMFESREW